MNFLPFTLQSNMSLFDLAGGTVLQDIVNPYLDEPFIHRDAYLVPLSGGFFTGGLYLADHRKRGTLRHTLGQPELFQIGPCQHHQVSCLASHKLAFNTFREWVRGIFYQKENTAVICFSCPPVLQIKREITVLLIGVHVTEWFTLHSDHTLFNREYLISRDSIILKNKMPTGEIFAIENLF